MGAREYGGLYHLLRASKMTEDLRTVIWHVHIFAAINDLGGAYLFFHSAKGLIRLESTDVCKAIHSQLRPEEKNLTGKEMISNLAIWGIRKRINNIPPSI